MIRRGLWFKLISSHLPDRFCRSWHLVRLNRLSRLHRAGPSASLDKSKTLFGCQTKKAREHSRAFNLLGQLLFFISRSFTLCFLCLPYCCWHATECAKAPRLRHIMRMTILVVELV